MAEYRRTAQIRAVSITDADLEELRRIVVEDIRSDESLRVIIKCEEGDKAIEANDVKRFAEQSNGTRALDSLDISFFFHSESGNSKITKYVSIDLRRRNGVMGSLLSISSPDQTWCYGKSQVLLAFLRRKRVWYWGIAGWGLPWVLCAISAVQLGIFLSRLDKHGSTSGTLISALSLLVSVLVYWLAAQGTLFPGFTFSREAAPKPSLMKNLAFWTVLACIFSGVQLLVAVATFILQRLR